MILELDMGNTRSKWRLRQAGQYALENAADNAYNEGVANSLSELLDQFAQLPEPEQLRIASVRKDESVQAVSRWCQDRWSLKPGLAVVSASCSGVSNSYEDPGRMGVDRWLALLAAFNYAKSACIVVDAGTALTIDAVDEAGKHLGGYILPGLSMMLDSLENNTGIRLQKRQFDADVGLGTNTESAVLNGSLALAVALIEKTVSNLKAENSQLLVIMSGGDAPLLQEALPELLDIGVEIHPSLVLDGLALADTVEAN